MYHPSDIDNFELLSSYLGTTANQLKKISSGTKRIVDHRKEAIFIIPAKESEVTKGSTDFTKFYIPKKDLRLGYRPVYKPLDQSVRDTLKVIKAILESFYEPEEYVQGFVKGRNTRSNANLHLDKKFLLSLDIKDFFGSISFPDVCLAFESIGFQEELAKVLASVCTLNQKLAQGFSTSPIIANMNCSEMDKEIQSLCEEYGATYSRYADDISISSDKSLPPINQIESILESFKFQLNARKTKRFRRGQNQFVTGLSISDSSYPRVPKAIKKRLRQKLYYIKKFGYDSHLEKTRPPDTNEFEHSETKERNNIKGWIDYIHSIEPELAKKMYTQFNEIEKAEREKWLEKMRRGGSAREFGIIEMRVPKIKTD